MSLWVVRPIPGKERDEALRDVRMSSLWEKGLARAKKDGRKKMRWWVFSKNWSGESWKDTNLRLSSDRPAAATISLSISSDGISSKNIIILNKAQVIIWDIDKSLGIGYDGDELEVISNISRLEEIDEQRYRVMLAEEGRILD